MDDKKFDEIMRAYVASTAKGEGHDLAKLKSKERPARKRIRSRAKFSAVAAAVVIAVTLSVCLPLTLVNRDSQNYGDSFSNQNFVVLDDVSQLEEEYGFSVIVPTAPMEMGVVASAIVNADNNVFLGARLDCLPMEWAFSNVTCYATRKGEMLPQVSDKIISPMNKLYWHGIKAHYQKQENVINTLDINNNIIALRVYSYWLHFDYDGVSYYINFEIYPDNATEDFELPDDEKDAAIYLLDFLYPDFVAQIDPYGLAVTA